MVDDSDVLEFERNPHLAHVLGKPAGKPDRGKDTEPGDEEEACAAFGFLRGISSRALALELRFDDGNSDWYAYSLLASWRHNPSVGLLLKFTGGDVVTLVLIRGSNLDQPVGQTGANLTDRGLQRHRITFIREMEREELRRAREGEPTIDRIEVAEFESVEEQQAWLQEVAPQFLRGRGKSSR